MQERVQVEVTNRNRAAVHTVGRRFRTNVPRTVTLTERQLKVVRDNPWLWITGEDWDGENEPDEYEDVLELEELTVDALKENLRALGLPVSGSKPELIERLREAEDESDSYGDGEPNEGDGEDSDEED